MNTITISQAEKNQIDWINAKYSEIDFVTSDYANEFIVMAQVENENAGLGRLVKIDNSNIELGGIYTFPNFRGRGVADQIVRSLLENNPFGESTIWCLPFENLLHFYSKFGFEECENNVAPERIAGKLTWCNTEGRYEKAVILLCKTKE